MIDIVKAKAKTFELCMCSHGKAKVNMSYRCPICESTCKVILSVDDTVVDSIWGENKIELACGRCSRDIMVALT